MNNSPEDEVDNNSKFHISNRNLKIVFSFFVFNSIIINMSIGTFSSLMSIIQSSLDITSQANLGFLSSILFIGQVIGCVICLFLIEFNIRKLLNLIYLSLCLASVLTIGIISNYWVLLFLRLLNGIGISYIAIFNPVWIDQFSPKSLCAIFMAVHNLSSIFGTILGFIMGSLLSTMSNNWNLSYLIQSFILIINVFIVVLVKIKYYDRRMMRINEESEVFIIYKSSSLVNNTTELQNKGLKEGQLNTLKSLNNEGESRHSSLHNLNLKQGSDLELSNNESRASSSLFDLKDLKNMNLIKENVELTLDNNNRPSFGEVLSCLVKNKVRKY